jgi:hypothetical protein
MNDVHAGGVNGGIADSKFPETPSRVNFARLGRRHFSAQGPIKSQVAESKPMITIFGYSTSDSPSQAKSQINNEENARFVNIRFQTRRKIDTLSGDQKTTLAG